MKITSVQPGSIAADLGIAAGDELLDINGQRVRDVIDFHFYEGDSDISLKVAHDGEVTIFDIEKDEGERIGIDIEEMRILSCGNDCIFCFVDQNPKGLRNQLYFRDGDYRLSFMYGNYTTMTNAGPAILQRIIDQRLSPQYISVHVTDLEVRKRLMGLRKDDQILEKIKLLHDNGIDMHTQIVLCPGINDGEVLNRTITDLAKFHRHIISLAVVPVGLTDHRFGLEKLRRADGPYSRDLLDFVEGWQKKLLRKTGRRFVYPSDEFFIVAGRAIPSGTYYDGFPQIENGVGIVRNFILDFRRQARAFPKRLPVRRSLTLVTGELAAGFMSEAIVPRLQQIGNLEARLIVVPNRLYGRTVTVAGLLSGNCIYFGLSGKEHADLVLLPPDIINADGLFLDDLTLPQLRERLGSRIMLYDGSWGDVFTELKQIGREQRAKTLVPSQTTTYSSESHV